MATLRGRRVGSIFPTGAHDRGIREETVAVSYWCLAGHETSPRFAATAPVPERWECRTCGAGAGLVPTVPPPPAPGLHREKSHLDHLNERRTASDGDRALADALVRLRQRGKTSEKT